MLSLNVTDFFKKQLVEELPGYTLRQSQIELALAIEQAIADKSVLIAEAGTGTGKTLAYLVPAFTSMGKVIVSTGTRVLQDQLFRKDAPMLKKAMSLPVRVALLKGRSNYLCHFHYHRLVDDEFAQLNSPQEAKQLKEIKLFFQRTKTGDKADCASVPETAAIWSRVTSTKENCLNKDCPYIDDCFVAKARANARDADVVVVNHALFFADIALRKEADIDLLPVADTIIFDEAHQLPDVATQFLGDAISLSDVDKVAKEIAIHTNTYVKSVAEWDKLCSVVKYDLLELRLIGGGIESMPGKRAVFDHIPEQDRFLVQLDTLLENMDALAQRLGAVAEHHIDLQETYNRLHNYLNQLYQWAYPERYQENDKNVYIRWVEFGVHQLRLCRAPLSVQNFANFKREDQAWIFTSATLSVNQQFTHFQAQLGLWDAECHTWDSPFNYFEKALMYVPTHLPSVKDARYERQFIEMLIPFIQRTPGGVLLLCTTLRAVEVFGDLLEEAFLKTAIHRAVLRQGSASPRALVDRFRQERNAVLVGSASFWEGSDFPGDLLTLVAIDKLPFAPPDDPILEARIEACRERGGNPFVEIQIPMATIALKQGAGRLIRTEHDSGVLIVGDDRLVSQRYSPMLWKSLPNFFRTRDLQVALSFWSDET